MKNIFIKTKKVILLILLASGSYFYSQVRIANSTANSSAANSSAFIDASSNPSYNATANVGKGLLFPRTDLTTFSAFSQGPFGIGNNYPTFYDGFIVFNTANSGIAGVGSTEGTLCRGFWYYDNPSTTIDGGTWKPVRPDLCSIVSPTVTTLDCPGAILTGTLTEGVMASGVSVQVPYTGGNGATYPAGLPIASTGVAGLTATLQGGTLANGNGNLTYTIAGTPTSSGNATFAISFGGQSCSFSIPVVSNGPAVTLNCTPVVEFPTGNLNITQGVNLTNASNYSSAFSYTVNVPGSYPGQTIPSTGVLGLTATLLAGQTPTNVGTSSTIVFFITGTALSTGIASFTFTFGGQTCTFTRTVVGGGGPVNPGTVVMCGSSKLWMTHNLGADMSANPNIPSAQIQGAKYQWGQPNAFVSQAGDQTPNPIAMPFYNANNSWGAIKTNTDPCPAGFRVPTDAEWTNLVFGSNPHIFLGVFTDSPTNFGGAIQYSCNGNFLTFPYVGERGMNNGAIVGRGATGMYWKSTLGSGSNGLRFTTGGPIIYNQIGELGNGYAVRCISE
ncbi:fibrobacter succinogenes major paralogous domain-containing protein [Chryseobacterium fistulae]|uniref:Uncharacterized protein n=1 Tax=Chryseobacterium fistulae TaxID=2675058 RepID=A0A6N4XW91_9FLAO|nr:FISUMP domain-containing protein [Chryseobacterium fistulae]CAA7392628.1 hypothetical protein CHRY9393_03353 [Chryseobacterium fistulae]